jgi:hypothetical protein
MTEYRRLNAHMDPALLCNLACTTPTLNFLIAFAFAHGLTEFGLSCGSEGANQLILAQFPPQCRIVLHEC